MVSKCFKTILPKSFKKSTCDVVIPLHEFSKICLHKDTKFVFYKGHHKNSFWVLYIQCMRYVKTDLTSKNIVINHFSFPLDKEDESNRQRVADFETTMEHAGIYLEYP